MKGIKGQDHRRDTEIKIIKKTETIAIEKNIELSEHKDNSNRRK